MTTLRAQSLTEHRHLLYLRDKDTVTYSRSRPGTYLSPHALDRRRRYGIPIKHRDLPVSAAYLQALNARGIRVLYPLKWPNAVVVQASREAIEQARTELPWILGDKPLTRHVPQAGPLQNQGSPSGTSGVCHAPSVSTPDWVSLTHPSAYREGGPAMPWGRTGLDYGPSLPQIRQLKLDSMHMLGITGLGVRAAVLDAGFLHADRHLTTRPLFDQGRVLGVWDIEQPAGNALTMDSHGQAVLSAMGGFWPGQLIGGAFEATYALIRTEVAPHERLDETTHWLRGLEICDSMGVEVVNTSLGYTTFDNRDRDFLPEQLDGRSTVISRYSSTAADCGMILVTSAGNSGRDAAWRGKISMPADADSTLAIGAVTTEGEVAPFSGRGPTVDGRIKPDLSAQGVGTVVALSALTDRITRANGTSFSSPMVAGGVVGLRQAFPKAPPMLIIRALLETASQASSPDTLIGYGLPDFMAAYRWLVREMALQTSVAIAAPYPNPARPGTQLTLAGPWAMLTLYDVTGRRVSATIRANETGVVTLPAVLKPGVYLARITLSGGAGEGIYRLVIS